MYVKQVNITTDAAGAFVADAALSGEVIAVALVIGTLSTPDITITDLTTGEAVFAKTGIASTDSWRPVRLLQSAAGVDLAAAAGPPAIANEYGGAVVYRHAHVVVAGGGDTLSGTLYIAYRG